MTRRRYFAKPGKDPLYAVLDRTTGKFMSVGAFSDEKFSTAWTAPPAKTPSSPTAQSLGATKSESMMSQIAVPLRPRLILDLKDGLEALSTGRLFARSLVSNAEKDFLQTDVEAAVKINLAGMVARRLVDKIELRRQDTLIDCESFSIELVAINASSADKISRVLHHLEGSIDGAGLRLGDQRAPR